MVELPYTIPQDHTFLNLLRTDALPIWKAKARWIAAHGGMILTLTHPDYSGREPYLTRYDELLKQLCGLEGAWRALPSQVAAWWRRRARMKIVVNSGSPTISGPSTEGAAARLLSTEGMLRSKLEGRSGRL